MKVYIVNNSKHENPFYATSQSAGMDLKANIEEPIVLKPLQRSLVPTGIKIALPEGYEAQIRPRSGLSIKKGIVAILGTIDADYRGEIGIILINLSNDDYVINDGDRLAQMVINKVEKVEWDNVVELDDTERGECGFGHSGIK